MKHIKSYTKEFNSIKKKMIFEIRNFFIVNPEVKFIDIEEVEGSEVNVLGDKIVNTITVNGVSDGGDERDFYQYEELDLCDLDILIDIINNFVSQNK